MEAHQRATDAQFVGHMRVCELRFEQQEKQNKDIIARLKSGDDVLDEIRELLRDMKPVVKEVGLLSTTVWGPDRQGGLVQGVRENTQSLTRINKTALAILGLITTNIGTLVALVWSWGRHQFGRGG